MDDQINQIVLKYSHFSDQDDAFKKDIKRLLIDFTTKTFRKVVDVKVFIFEKEKYQVIKK